LFIGNCDICYDIPTDTLYLSIVADLQSLKSPEMEGLDKLIAVGLFFLRYIVILISELLMSFINVFLFLLESQAVAQKK